MDPMPSPPHTTPGAPALELSDLASCYRIGLLQRKREVLPGVNLILERGRCLVFGGECLARQKPLMEVIGARRAVVVAALAIEATGVGEGCCRNKQQRWE